MDGGSLARVKGMARGLTGVIVGAGPSLLRFGPALRELRDKAFIATALQTLPALERLGIKPDLCLAIDFNARMSPNWVATGLRPQSTMVRALARSRGSWETRGPKSRLWAA